MIILTACRPLPPWYLQQPSVHSGSEFWTHASAPGRHSDLSVGAEGGRERSSYNSRIPILVATTTSTPRRIPITTPKPTTTTQSTTTSTTPGTTESETASEDEAATSQGWDSVLLRESNEAVINREPGELDDKVDSKFTKEYENFKFIFHVYECDLFNFYHKNLAKLHFLEDALFITIHSNFSNFQNPTSVMAQACLTPTLCTPPSLTSRRTWWSPRPS